MSTRVVAVIPAAGLGTRLAAGEASPATPKALRVLVGRTLLQHSVDALGPYVDAIIVARPTAPRPSYEVSSRVPVQVVDGGATRQESVANALAAVGDDVTWVLVHDAARPLVPGAVVRRVLDALRHGAEAVVPAIASPDSLRQVDAAGRSTPLSRDDVRLVQTPQGFTVDALRRGHAAATDAAATDDATLVEALGIAVTVVEGDPLAFKITRPLDIALAETLLRPSAP